MRKFLIVPTFCVLILLLQSCSDSSSHLKQGTPQNERRHFYLTAEDPIVFVTSVPLVSDNGPLSAFSNHATSILDSIPGGDLYIRYPNGDLRNLTAEAGWGISSGELQAGSRAIAVRQPFVHWGGNKVLFSMLVGGPVARFDRVYERKWQIYEAMGVLEGESVVIAKVEGQPDYNNISPIYDSHNDIIFISDAPVDSLTHTYPQLDEYESMPTNTGVWKINRQSSTYSILEHAPSGVFDLSIDSFGRILFTKWDHLKRDQQADSDRYSHGQYGAMDFESEKANATVKKSDRYSLDGNLLADKNGVLYDLFPEARTLEDPTKRPNENLNNMNQFFIWQINQDGSNEETINHLGRQEIGGIYMPPSFNDDTNLSDRLPELGEQSKMRDTFTGSSGIFQLKEDGENPGQYLGTYAMEFARDSSGRIVGLDFPPERNPEDVLIKDYTNKTIDYFPEVSKVRLPSQTGHYRGPLRISRGDILVSHTNEYRNNDDESVDPNTIKPRYLFQLKKLIPNPLGDDFLAGDSITGGIKKSILWWGDLETPRYYQGELNEVDAVELKKRNPPPYTSMKIDPIEQNVFTEENINVDEFRDWLKKNNLALIVSRNLTLRDRADIAQPYNLRIPGGVENIPKSGKIYDISGLQIFKAELTRGYKKLDGRRVYARPIHDKVIEKYYRTFGDNVHQNGITNIALDGSMATLVPAQRALSWQMLDPEGAPVVKERVWISFAPGEIRTCAGCHGINKETLNGLKSPTNKPEALRSLLKIWKSSL